MSDLKINLIVISGPSAVGKTSIAKRLIKDFPSLTVSISLTTRKPRDKEQNNVDYIFTSEKDFKEKIKEEYFLEWSKVHENYYGTPKSVLSSENITVLILDCVGAMKIKELYPNTITIFIKPSNIKELEQRLKKRGDKETNVKLRMFNALKEIEENNKFDYVVINSNLDKTYEEVKNILIQ